jgi:hypothetical protein
MKSCNEIIYKELNDNKMCLYLCNNFYMHIQGMFGIGIICKITVISSQTTSAKVISY